MLLSDFGVKENQASPNKLGSILLLLFEKNFREMA